MEPKRRKLTYPSNRDACIFAYYAHLLSGPYEDLLRQRNLDDAVIGYRRVGSNAELAARAFSEIRKRKDCVALAYDISGFFDEISHAQLKSGWQDVLGVSRLPDDHFAVFKALTRFSTVDRRACLRRLGLPVRARDQSLARPPLCDIATFRATVRGDDGLQTNLVQPWQKPYRIPQGTPLSAMAANIAMLDFDAAINSWVDRHGGVYRRYSDDILVVVPNSLKPEVVAVVRDALRNSAGNLRLQEKKTLEVSFVGGRLATGARPLQYLGFLFDGRRALIRPNTLARYWRRAHRAVKWLKRQQSKAVRGKISGRTVVHRKEMHARLSHLGVDSFVTKYVRRSAAVTKSPGINAQLRRHMKKLNELLKRPR